MGEELKTAIAQMNTLPDISHNDSERLRGFMRVTAVETKAVGGVGAATSLEMIGYIRELEHRLSPRDMEIREVLVSLATKVYASFPGEYCWCSRPTLTTRPEGDRHDLACLAARALWERVQGSVKHNPPPS